MPLDTRPLTPGRQAMLVGVLLLFFLGSLGFAQLLVMRTKTVAAAAPAAGVRFIPPKGFVQEGAKPTFGTYQAAATFAAQVHGQPRKIYLFVLPVKQTTEKALRDKALALYTALTGAHGALPVMRRAEMAGEPALDLSGELTDRSGFVMMRAAFDGDSFLAIVYAGSTGQTEEDLAVFEDAVGSDESGPGN